MRYAITRPLKSVEQTGIMFFDGRGECIVTITSDDPPPSPPPEDTLVLYREAVAREAVAYRTRARHDCMRHGRPLTRDECSVLQEMIRRVRWTRPSGSLVLAEDWPTALERLASATFVVARDPGEPKLCSHTGFYRFPDPSVFSHDHNGLMNQVVQITHSEACAHALARSLGLNIDEVLLATEQYTNVARPYRRIVEATRRYNMLTWWFTKTAYAQQGLTSEAVTQEEERRLQLALTSLERLPVHSCAAPLEELTPGNFILPRGLFRGLTLCPTLIRDALLGDRFPNAFSDLE